MGLQIKKAVRHESKLRMALYGPAGSGKTYTSLAIATAIAKKGVVVIDTERRRAEKYAKRASRPHEPGFVFDVIEMDHFSPVDYIEAIKLVEKSGDYDVLIIDSVSHEWEGRGGCLELVRNDVRNWAKVTPLHNAFLDAMLSSSLHVIATIRAKDDVVIGEENGKTKVSKVACDPITRKGVQFEFDVIGMLDVLSNTLAIEKTCYSPLTGKAFVRAGKDIAAILLDCLEGDTPAIVESNNQATRQIEPPTQEAVKSPQPIVNLSDIPSAASLRHKATNAGLDWEKDVLAKVFANSIAKGSVSLEKLIAKGDELPPNYCQHINGYLNKQLNAEVA